MNFLEKLDYLMLRMHINKSGLSQISGVPYTTIDGFYKKGYENVKLSTIKKIAAALDVSLDYLIDDSPDDLSNFERFEPGSEETKEAPALDQDERSRIQAIFDQLSPANRTKLLELANLYLDAQNKTQETP